jgi:hypothetical protein
MKKIHGMKNMLVTERNDKNIISGESVTINAEAKANLVFPFVYSFTRK